MPARKEIEYSVAENGCWIITSHTGKDKYRKVHRDGKYIMVHRYAYEQANGPIPKGKVIMHLCDNTRCINPAHLKAGTHKQNSVDMMKKGRAANGEKNGNGRLTEAIVREIRSSPKAHKKFAAKYGVHEETIARIFHRKIWKHI